MSNEQTNQSAKAWVKWVVLGAIALVFMVLFKAEIGELLGRTQELKLTSEGLIVKVQTTSTPLGETLVSNVSKEQLPQSPSLPALPGGRVRTYRGDAFLLSYPDTGDWLVDEAAAGQLRHMGALLVLKYKSPAATFHPNINVTVEDVGNLSYQEWLDAGNLGFTQLGVQIIKSEVDPHTEGAVRVMLYPLGFYQTQRVLMHSGKAYVITASSAINGDPQVATQMRDILNSFRLI